MHQPRPRRAFRASHRAQQPEQKQELELNFFDKIHETQITRKARQPRPVPLHRRLFPVEFWSAGMSQQDIARAAVREVLG
jgi:hypothetical protein